jgi:hypothetical protein
MPPVRQWCYTKEKGTHWWEPPAEEFAPLCRFVREQARLLDGYEGVARVGLLYSNAAFRRYQRAARDACSDLVAMNVPFRIVLAGDERLEARLELADLADVDALVVVEPTHLSAPQQSALEMAAHKVVEWPGKERLRALAPRIEVEGAPGVTVVPRVRPEEAAAPFACHLVNRSYNPQTDSMRAQTDLRLRLDAALFDGPVTGATLHAPGRESAELEVTEGPGGVEIAIPRLELWAILELKR